ncbi:DUF6233 domain-containing protein [Streptomyces sp. Ru72]|uniref:DUF6233 domain-containing protein n=1 Tax=Streptomyces sp. Ru72 TaxID=2080747 RepID=UPI001C729005
MTAIRAPQASVNSRLDSARILRSACPPPRYEPTTNAAYRWARKIQRGPAFGGRPGALAVHVWDCEEAPGEAEELDVFAALAALRRPGAVARTECGADVALGPLMQAGFNRRAVRRASTRPAPWESIIQGTARRSTGGPPRSVRQAAPRAAAGC